MNPIKLLLLAFALVFCPRLVSRHRTANAESNAGTHAVLTLLADAAFSYTHLLVKAGTDASHVDLCGAANFPKGITDDQPEAAEDVVNVTPLGNSKTTRKVRVATLLATDIDLYTAASGFAQAEPAIAGTYYKVGRSVAAAVQVGSGDYLIEFQPCHPVKLVVVAALTSSQNATTAASDPTTTQALANALKTSYNALQADVAALGVGLATPALVKVLT